MSNFKTESNPDGLSKYLTIAITLIISFLIMNNANSQPKYTVRNLGTQLGHISSYAMAINDRGQVTGHTLSVNSTTARAFVIAYPYTSMINLNTLHDTSSSYAKGINNNGVVCGYSRENSTDRMWLWSDEFIAEVPAPVENAENNLYGINDNGRTVGSTDYKGLIYYNGQRTLLPTLPSYSNSIALSINNSNVIAGYNLVGISQRIACKWDQGVCVELPSLGGTESSAHGIADNGWIVGSSYQPDDVNYHAILIKPGENIQDLGVLVRGGDSSASATNGKDIVGRATVAENEYHAIVYKDDTLYDLNDLIPHSSGWVLEQASDINAYGQICGYGELNGIMRAYLLTPDPQHTAGADFDFTEGDHQWTAETNVPPFAAAEAQWTPGIGYGVKATGYPCYAFLQSPEMTLLPARKYKIFCTIASTAPTAETCPQVRLRAFETATNRSEMLALDSVDNVMPSLGAKEYQYLIATPDCTGEQTWRFYLDFTNFNPLDDQEAWIYLERFVLLED